MDPQSEKYAVHEAARVGDVSRVNALLSTNPTLSTLKDTDDRLPLHWALSNNHLDIVEALVAAQEGLGRRKGAWDVDVRDGSGWTPLMIASSVRDGEDMVRFLLGKGADVNAQNSAGQTSLHLSTSKSSLQTTRLLLSHGASARKKDRRGQLPLHRAAAIGSVPLVQLLLENKSPVNASDEEGWTGLHHAIAEGNGDTALVLLKSGAEPNIRNSEGKLAIQLAPDKKVREFVVKSAEAEGIDLVV